MKNLDEIKKLFNGNEYSKYSSMEFVNLDGDNMILKMKPGSRQQNIYGMIHGGEIFSLLDTASGLLCVAQGKNVVTLNSTINFIKNVPVGETIFSKTKFLHNGASTMVVDAFAYTEENLLLAKASFTFYNLK